MAPSDEMKAVQESISLLRGESREDPTIKAKPCFCQGRRHLVHPQVPLCLNCGLVLCSILHPSPLLLPSTPCPSCAAPILNTTSRAILLAQLDMQFASLAQSHEEKMRLIEEEKQKAWQEKRKEVELFPELANLQLGDGVGSSSGNNTLRQKQEYDHFYERRKAMDIAMGRRVDNDDTRKPRVIRIGGPTVSVKKKKKGTAKKASPVDTNSKVSSKESAKSPLEVIKKQEEDVASSGEESEDEMLDYDPLNEVNGPVPDEDDDGFARHAIITSRAETPNRNGSFWAASSDMPSIRYIPEKERSSYSEPSIPDVASEKRQVPGAAKD